MFNKQLPAIIFTFLLVLSLPVATFATNDILDLDLESLMQIKITSAGRKEQNLMHVPAAVYVINQDDIRHSGVTSIPEALRMVPGLQVARISSNKWAITSRGFNGTFANKLLVQIDGRSIYTPTYSGVYWDAQNVVLEDIERIEVIRGPGATLWGANAVNGVINIITKQASDTQGGLVVIGTGTHEKLMATARYGTQFNNDTYGRFYIKYHDQDSYELLADNTDAYDDWDMTNGGFRLDGDFGLKSSWTLQGDMYGSQINERIRAFWSLTPPNTDWTMTEPYKYEVEDQIRTNGYNLLGRWQLNTSETSAATVQIYYDYANRDSLYLDQTNQTLDIDLQHRFQASSIHDIVWGLGYRYGKDDFGNTFQVGLYPPGKTTQLFSAFLQDEIALIEDKVSLFLGAKCEKNDYTGFEVQPNLRLLWKINNNNSLWTSFARAVKTPSQIEDSSRLVTRILPPMPPFTTEETVLTVNGNSGIDSEQLIAYEVGYRHRPNTKFSIDTTLFYNDYSDIQSYSSSGSQGASQFVNAIEGETYGLEITTVWSPLDWLETELNYSYINSRFNDSGLNSFNVSGVLEGSAPRHQFSVRTHLKITETLYLNLWGHYTDRLKAPSISAQLNDESVDDYFRLDANIQWIPQEKLELTLAGQNLTDSKHLEFISESLTPQTEIKRSIYAKLTWKF